MWPRPKYFLPRTQNTFTWDSKPTATYFVRSMQGVLLSVLRILVIFSSQKSAWTLSSYIMKTIMKFIMKTTIKTIIYHENHDENLHCCQSFAQELRPGPTRCFPRRSWILALGTFWFVFWYDVRLIFNDDIDKKLDPGSWHLLDGQCHRLPIDCDKPARLTITVLLFLFVK